jgi:hypothetical protein
LILPAMWANASVRAGAKPAATMNARERLP